MQSKWTGKWRVNSLFEHSYGKTGELTVDASNESDAQFKIQCEASRKVFGTTMRSSIIGVSELKEIKKQYR